jgi:hypothetical protein
VFFNYIGMIEEFAEAGGPWRREEPEDGLLEKLRTHPRQKCKELLLCSALISQGRFKLCMGYSKHIFHRSTVEKLVNSVMTTVRGVLQPYTPGAAQIAGEYTKPHPGRGPHGAAASISDP